MLIHGGSYWHATRSSYPASASALQSGFMLLGISFGFRVLGLGFGFGIWLGGTG